MKLDSTHWVTYNRFIVQRYNVTNQILTLERILNDGVYRLGYSSIGYRLLASFIDWVIHSRGWGGVRIFHYINSFIGLKYMLFMKYTTAGS